VRHLNNGQEREQQQAHNRHQRQSAKLCVERVAEVICDAVNTRSLELRIHAIEYWMSRISKS